MWKSEGKNHVAARLRNGEVGDGIRGWRLGLHGVAGSRTTVQYENGKEKVENGPEWPSDVRCRFGCEVPFSNFHFLISREYSGSDPGLSRCSQAASEHRRHRASSISSSSRALRRKSPRAPSRESCGGGARQYSRCARSLWRRNRQSLRSRPPCTRA